MLILYHLAHLLKYKWIARRMSEYLVIYLFIYLFIYLSMYLFISSLFKVDIKHTLKYFLTITQLCCNKHTN